MNKKEQRARSEESLARICGLLQTIRFQPTQEVSTAIIAEMVKTEDFSPEDMAGTDLWLELTPEFAEFTGIRQLGVQSKSSEAGVEQFANHGKKKFGRTGKEWQKQGRILLNGGQWADGSIVTDFLVQ